MTVISRWLSIDQMALRAPFSLECDHSMADHITCDHSMADHWQVGSRVLGVLSKLT